MNSKKHTNKAFSITKKALLILIIIIILLNIIFAILSYSGNYSYILKIKPYAMVFAHGHYTNDCINKINETILFTNGTKTNSSSCNAWINYHESIINNKKINTSTLIENLNKKGYNKIWLSQCETGNSPYIKFYSYRIDYNDLLPKNNTNIEWNDTMINRNKFYGNSFPIFTGFSFIRIPIGDLPI